MKNHLLGYVPRWVSSSLSSGDGTANQSGGRQNRREDNWVDGLRGIASLIVLTGHLNSGWAYHLHQPAISENGPSTLFQHPILRLAIGGRGAVAIFFIITGYVNSLGAIRNFRAGNITPSLLNMSRRSFTRIGRLYLPTAIAVIISWLCTRIGLYHVGTRIDCKWYRDSSTHNDTFEESLLKLWDNLTIFWHTTDSYYDPYHWTMSFILAASFRVYMVLLVMGFLKRRYCYLVTAILYFYSWRTRDYYVGLNAMVGMFLAQLHVDLGARATSLLPRAVPFVMMICGVLLWGYPLFHPEWAWWSLRMQQFMQRIGPQDQDTISRFYCSIGPTIVMLGITFSRDARRFLTLPLFNFLGRCSYAVYLLHHTLIRTILIWLLYGPAYLTTPEKDEQGNVIQLKSPSKMAFFIIMPLFYCILYFIAHLWTKYVDAYCAKIVDRAKDIMFREDEKPQEKLIPLNGVTIGHQ